ncbi:nucleotide-binding domain containing protein [Tessaracoccus coleopterorum]|uniref:nucleotide-binding domain containing protein n=1 Tax=Tessaracoccus coleopterorum TaxID=2714950 RepID=UPI001E30BCD4|nr:nucleotide-binding domain containing protein [Tessaracoccus coleopterorum]
MIGQDVRPPLDGDRLAETLPPDAEVGGLIVVGSHVALTTRQLEYLVADQQPHEVEVDVEQVLGADKGTYLSGVADDVVEHLRSGNVVLRTSRELVRGRDGDDSLRIARSVSDAVVQVVRRTLAAARPRFVIAKGGITSSDVAAHGLQIGRAVVRGPMLPGIVSLWEPIDGPAVGIPTSFSPATSAMTHPWRSSPGS